MKGTRESLEEGVIEGREGKKTGGDQGMEIRVSQWLKSGCVKQQQQEEEEGSTVRGGKGLQDKEKLCKVVKKSSMKDCTPEHLLRATKFPPSKANVHDLPLASQK